MGAARRSRRTRGCEAIRLGLLDPAAHNNLGLSLHLLGRHTEAAGAFLNVLESRPDDAMAHTNLGAALRALGEQARALDHMKRAVDLDPNFASARNNLGQFLLESGRPDQALPHCQAAVALQPEMAEAHLSILGNVYRRCVHFAEARWCYGEAVRKNPEMSQACVSLALTLQLEGRWDDALPWLRRALEVQPGSLDYLALLAEAEVDREHFAESIECYQKMIERDPGDATAHNALGWLLQEEGQLDLSAEHLRTALRLQPDLAVANVTLGSLHEKMGDFVAAEACFRRLAIKDDAARSHARLAAWQCSCEAKVPRRRLQGNRRDGSLTRTRMTLARPEPLLRPGKRLGCARALCRSGPPTLAPRRTLSRLSPVSAAKHGARSGPEHERFVSGLIEGFGQPAVRATGERRAHDEAARVYRRPATLGYHTDRADPG